MADVPRLLLRFGALRWWWRLGVPIPRFADACARSTRHRLGSTRVVQAVSREEEVQSKLAVIGEVDVGPTEQVVAEPAPADCVIGGRDVAGVFERAHQPRVCRSALCGPATGRHPRVVRCRVHQAAVCCRRMRTRAPRVRRTRGSTRAPPGRAASKRGAVLRRLRSEARAGRGLHDDLIHGRAREYASGYVPPLMLDSSGTHSTLADGRRRGFVITARPDDDLPTIEGQPDGVCDQGGGSVGWAGVGRLGWGRPTIRSLP